MDDLLQPLRDRLGLARRLGVHLAQQRLAEVGQRGAGEAADESLRRRRRRARSPRPRTSRHERSSTRTPASSSTARELVGARRRGSRGCRARRTRESTGRRHASASTCACSGSPVVVRSPASRIDVRLALRPARTRAPRARGSPRTHGRRPLPRSGSHHRCCTFGQTGNGAAMPESVLRRADRRDEGRRRRPPADAEIPFVLGGGLVGVGARRPEERARRRPPAEAATTPTQRSRRSRRPAGGRSGRRRAGSYKTWHANDALVDLIFNPASGPITDEIIERAPVAEVMALRHQRVDARGRDDGEADGDDRAGARLQRLLEWARALREQIDWDDVRARTEASPFAKAFFTLVEALGIVEPAR